MRHLPLETGATGQIDADFVQLRLQLQGRDVPSRGVSKVAGGPPMLDPMSSTRLAGPSPSASAAARMASVP